MDIHCFPILKYLNLKKLCNVLLNRKIQPKNLSSGDAIEDLKNQVASFLGGSKDWSQIYLLTP